MTLMRLTIAGAIASGSSSTSRSVPSMRNRTRSSNSWGSMWTSEARSRTAWVSSRFTIWITGARSSVMVPADAAAAAASAAAVARAEGALGVTAPGRAASAISKAWTMSRVPTSAEYAREIVARISSAGATNSRTSRPVCDRSAGSRPASVGSATTTSTVEALQRTGMTR